MFKRDVIRFFKTQSEAARAIKVSKVAVNKWKRVIPELRARQFAEITEGQLEFRAEAYADRKKRSAA